MRAKIETTDRAYRLSHFTSPRGRGGWAFEATYYDVDGNTKTDDELIWVNDTFAAARSEAKKVARERAASLAREHNTSVALIVLDAQP